VSVYFSFTRERLREEKRIRQGGRREWEVREISTLQVIIP